MIANKATAKKPDIRLLLDNIRSAHNTGSIFRTAETLGITKIYCAGTTPMPIDRFGRKRRDFAKVALGAEDMVPWEHLTRMGALSLVRRLKKEGFKIIALEQADRSIEYKKIRRGKKMLIVLGNEVEGVSQDFIGLADEIAELSMKGRKESLNVSVAAGIFLFRLLD